MPAVDEATRGVRCFVEEAADAVRAAGPDLYRAASDVLASALQVRSKAEITRLVDGLELVEPGLEVITRCARSTLTSKAAAPTPRSRCTPPSAASLTLSAVGFTAR
jgi:hypothetical protein